MCSLRLLIELNSRPDCKHRFRKAPRRGQRPNRHTNLLGQGSRWKDQSRRQGLISGR